VDFTLAADCRRSLNQQRGFFRDQSAGQRSLTTQSDLFDQYQLVGQHLVFLPDIASVVQNWSTSLAGKMAIVYR